MRCDQCRMWEERVDIEELMEGFTGTCRRFPPKEEATSKYPRFESWQAFCQPLTLGHDWCGEFTPIS